MKVKIWCRTHDLQSKEEDIIDLEEFGFTVAEIKKIKAGNGDDQLNDIAKNFFFEKKQPEWGFELVDS